MEIKFTMDEEIEAIKSFADRNVGKVVSKITFEKDTTILWLGDSGFILPITRSEIIRNYYDC